MFQNILVPIDGSARSAAVLPYAAELASKFEGRITLLYVTPDPLPLMMASNGMAYLDAGQEAEANLLAGAELLERARQTLTARPDLRVDAVQLPLEGRSVAETIVRAAREQRSDLLVMATHGRSGLSHMLMGSIAEATLKKLNIPVLLLRPDRA